MKKTVVIVFIVFMIFTGCMTSDYYFSDIPVVKKGFEYKTTIDFRDDIDNPSYTVKLEPLSIKTDDYPRGKESFNIYYTTSLKEVDGVSKSFLVMIQYVGDDWRFMKGGVKVKLDNELLILEDKNPYHSVLSAGGVLEIISIPLLDDTIDKLLLSKTLTIQYYQSPVRFTPEELEVIGKFVSNYYGKTYEEMKSLYENQ